MITLNKCLTGEFKGVDEALGDRIWRVGERPVAGEIGAVGGLWSPPKG